MSPSRLPDPDASRIFISFTEQMMNNSYNMRNELDRIVNTHIYPTFEHRSYGTSSSNWQNIVFNGHGMIVRPHTRKKEKDGSKTRLVFYPFGLVRDEGTGHYHPDIAQIPKTVHTDTFYLIEHLHSNIESFLEENKGHHGFAGNGQPLLFVDKNLASSFLYLFNAKGSSKVHKLRFSEDYDEDYRLVNLSKDGWMPKQSNY